MKYLLWSHGIQHGLACQIGLNNNEARDREFYMVQSMTYVHRVKPKGLHCAH